MNDEVHDTFEVALARYLDGEPEPGDGERIAEAMRTDPAKIRQVTGLAAVDELLRQHSEPGDRAFVEGLAVRLDAQWSGGRFLRRIERRLGSPAGPAALARRLPWMLTALACIVAAVGWWRAMSPRFVSQRGTAPALRAAAPTAVAPGACAVSSASDGEPLALMVNQAEARFSAGAAPDIVSFGRGNYTLEHGSAHLRFRNGTDVVIVAPTRLRIDDVLHVQLGEGTLRALVPPPAHGFEVSAPGVQFRDMGTEFGVKVPAGGGGASELHVFDGQVQIFKPGAAKPRETVYGGESVRVSGDSTRPGGAAREMDFPSVNSISLSRWLAWRAQFHADPDLVLYYPFVRNATDPARLDNDALFGPPIRGQIQGAEWVTGRWPGKSALQFEGAGDEVALDIPGQYDQLTLAAWIKVDRVENVEHTILSSVGWAPGGLQWQFNRRRSVASTAVFSDPKRRVLYINQPLPLGRWVFWAVTIDRATGRILHYLDGKLVGEARIAPGTLIQPGQAAIGRWINSGDMPQVREFRGRIDELAVWRVALPQSRIQTFANAGMPVELPDPVVARSP